MWTRTTRISPFPRFWPSRSNGTFDLALREAWRRLTNRARRDLSSSGKILSDTSHTNYVSPAQNTSAIPTAPTGETISYGPRVKSEPLRMDDGPIRKLPPTRRIEHDNSAG